jgi:dCTP deaminase-like
VELGRNFIEVCKCAGWGDIGYTNRWTMEITNNSRHYSIPLVVGRRVAQIIFFESEGCLGRWTNHTDSHIHTRRHTHTHTETQTLFYVGQRSVYSVPFLSCAHLDCFLDWSFDCWALWCTYQHECHTCTRTPLPVGSTYESSGKYQSASDLKSLQESWDPHCMLPRMYQDREVREMQEKMKEHAPK